jgi:hypothetical protein
MKRLWVVACLVIGIVSVFGGFSSPKFIYAAKAEYLAAGNTLLASIINTSLISTYNKKQRDENILDFNQLKLLISSHQASDPSGIGDQAFQKNVLSDFKAYLQDRSISQTDNEVLGVISKINSDVTAIDSKLITNSLGTVTVKSAADIQDSSVLGPALGPPRGTETVNNTNCSFFITSSFTDCISAGVEWLIKNTLLELAGFLVWAAANLFNYAVQVGILHFADWATPALYPIWVIIRQIVSLLIVFVGLYLGFMYILGKDEKFAKYIPWVIMFALFVNFSYPLTRVAIDLSNIVSLNLYSNAVGSAALNAGISDPTSAGAIIVDKLGLGGLAASATKSTADGALLGAINSIPGALAAVAFLLYAAYILFIVTGIIVMRTAVLVFLTVASPILLVDSVLPMLGDQAQKLRKIFFEQLMVAPIFMLMLSLTLKFLTVFSGSGGPLGAGTGVGKLAQGGSITSFFNIIMMLVMLHIMIKVTKATAGEIGNFATTAMGKVGGFGLGMATGGLAGVGRQAGGRLAQYAENKGWVSRNPDSVTGRISSTLKNSSFDLRNSKVIAQGAGAIGFGSGLLGVGMGSGSAKTYQASKEKRERGQATAVESINKDADKKFKTTYQEDVYNDDNTIKYRKGEVDKDAVVKRADFIQKEAGKARFLTKEQHAKLIQPEVDSQSESTLAEYKKIKTTTEKKEYTTQLEKDLIDLRKSDPTMKNAQTQAVTRALFEINKQKKESEVVMLENLERYKHMAEDKQRNYYANMGVNERKDFDVLLQENGLAIPTLKTTTTTPRQPQQSVRETSVKMQLNTAPSALDTSGVLTSPASASATPIIQTRGTSEPLDIDLSQPFKLEEVSTEDFAQKIAAKRAAAQKISFGAVRNEMNSNKEIMTLSVPGVVIPSTTTSAPKTPAANSSQNNNPQPPQASSGEETPITPTTPKGNSPAGTAATPEKVAEHA